MSAKPVFLRLPVELLDHIVKFCNDKATLSTIRLVCESWESLAQPLLFDRTCIKPKPFNSPCESILSQDDSVIARRIRHIMFEDDKAVGLGPGVLLRYYLGVVNRLKEKGVSGDLRSLGLIFYTFDDVLFDKSAPTFFTSLTSSFSNIVELNLWFCNENLEEFIRFMCSFPRLEILGVKFDAWLECSEKTSESLAIVKCTLPESLKSFHCAHPFAHNSIAYFLEWVASHPPRSVEELSVLWTRTLNLEDYSRFCCKTLRHLLLNFRISGVYNTGIQDDSIRCDLSQLDVLEILTVNFDSNYEFEEMHFMLDTLKSRRFRRIEFIIEPTPFEHSHMWADDGQWEELDEVLAGSDKFVGVMVEIQVMASYVLFMDAEEQIRKILRRCHSQGRLSVIPFYKDGPKEWSVIERWRRVDRGAD
ncbi:hypothetical protein E1B28_012004 [Marasmius oreades]|uniref:F-box domain-containing protein n=1 Tax=Marasmius oreades TaxID=181124 RepID=A0A9P7UN81_9AGAR|nr:uncharacterized protein E1B28_012004 [Marasmius oreades]KAG7087963.1 hypothetical protein E1B28_012004 [Marasmius oreades]